MKKQKRHTTGYTTPDDYFEVLEAQLRVRMAEASLPNNSGFSIPDGYFDTVEANVMSAVLKQDTEVTNKVIPFFGRKIWLGVATVAAAIVVLFTIQTFVATRQPTIDTLQADAIATYIYEGNVAISTQDITGLFDDEFVNLEFSTEAISEETITDYLLDHVDDPILLMEY